MTGFQLRRVRETIDVDPFAWAALLGVHVSTVYRWEQAKGDVGIDPLQLAIVEKIRAAIHHRTCATRIKTAITNGLVVGGTLHALHNVLDIILAKR